MKILITPRNYEIKIPEFYNRKGKQQIEKFAKQDLKKQGLEPKIINWDDKKGLISISMNEGGIDLENQRFKLHNIHYESKLGKSLTKIIEYYFKLINNIKK